MKQPNLLTILLLSILVSCTSQNEEIDSYQSMSESDSSQIGELKKAPSSKFLAYEHYIDIKIKKEKLEPTFSTLVDLCLNDTTFNCSILNSSHRGGNYANASLRLRLKGEGIETYLKAASESGEITSQSTQAEDLSSAIADTEKRIEMLTSYRDRLLELEKKPDNDIESLIKISSELANVQTQLEFSSGEKARLYQRIDLDILNITLNTYSNTAFYHPIVDALTSFFEDLSEGIAIFINVVAYLLPWMLAITFPVLAIRKRWRRKKALKQE